jgi:hypothetical protein
LSTPAGIAPDRSGDTGGLRGAVRFAGDMLGAAVVILCIPLAVLAIGIPIALLVRLLLFVTGQL